MIVRATINLPGLARGQEAEADPEVTYIATCLEAGYLVEVETESGEDRGAAADVDS